MIELEAARRRELRRNVEMAESDNWLNAKIIEQLQRIDTAMREDPSKPHSNSAYEAKAGEMLNFARARIAFVKCELERGAGNSSCRAQ